jgi:hypothetical protein
MTNQQEDPAEARMLSIEKGNRALHETLATRSAHRHIIETLFGKRQCDLTPEEIARYRRLAKTVSYYRRHERNKAQQRKDKSWRKVEILQVLGWDAACMRCGYDKYIGALDFHHRDPHTKDGRVTTVEEARKCDLICANCHREVEVELRAIGHTIKGGRPLEAADPLLESYMRLSGLSEEQIATAMSGRPEPVLPGIRVITDGSDPERMPARLILQAL